MITIERKNQMRKMLIENKLTVEDIAKETGVSIRTVYRIKKEIPPNQEMRDVLLGDNLLYDYKDYYSAEEKKHIERIKEDLYLYEDTEEGWIYHYDKENSIIKTSGLWWNFIAYPESVCENWIEKLEETGLAIEISPLHDKDPWEHDSPERVDPKTGEIYPRGHFYKAGDKKKSHWHGTVVCNKSTSWKVINKIIRDITHGPYLQRCNSLLNSHNYKTHRTESAMRKGKYQYDPDEIITLNNFHVEPNKYEIGVLQCEITKMILENNLDTTTKVAEFFQDQPEIMQLIWSKPGFINALVRSRWKENHPESKVQFTHEVTNEELEKLNEERLQIVDSRKKGRK